MVYYLPEESLEKIFEFVSKRYARIEEVPRYREERRFDEFCGVLRQAHSDTYYPTVLEKAVYLLVSINKGHFFSNGNKRLALVVMTLFLAINDLQLKMGDKPWYRTILSELFPEYKQWEDFKEFNSTDFATYNLSIMIADSGVYGISHDELKQRVHSFLERTIEKFS